MENPLPKKNALEVLRTRSWEMELLLSGFVLVLLLPLPAYIDQEAPFSFLDVEYGIVNQFLILSYFVALIGTRILIANLILYLFLRGFWIGIVGLITAFPKEIDFERLGYQARFQQFLSNRTLRTELFVERLNKVCSSVFSFSFLAVFMVIASFLFLFLLVCIIIPINALNQYPDDHWASQTLNAIVITIIILWGLLGLIALIDFLSLGLLKRIRKKWFTSVYFPLYRFFRFVTLAPVYTPIYYTLVSNISKKVVATLFLCYFSVFFFINNYTYDDEVFFSNKDSAYTIDKRYYEEYYDEKELIVRPTIPSEYTNKRYLRLFIPYNVDYNDSLEARCPEVILFKDKGLQSEGEISINLGDETSGADTLRYTDANTQAALRCLLSLFQIAIDDKIHQEPPAYFHRHPNGQAGIIAYLPVRRLSPGPHLLTITRIAFQQEEQRKDRTTYIPFIKE